MKVRIGSAEYYALEQADAAAKLAKPNLTEAQRQIQLRFHTTATECRKMLDAGTPDQDVWNHWILG